jgi:hypothetical protein
MGGDEDKSILQRALAAMSSKHECESGLSGEPLVLLLLDDRTLNEQTPMGRQLLHALSQLGISTLGGKESVQRRSSLLGEAQEFFLGSDNYWAGLARQSPHVLKVFKSCNRGKKGDIVVSMPCV